MVYSSLSSLDIENLKTHTDIDIHFVSSVLIFLNELLISHKIRQNAVHIKILKVFKIFLAILREKKTRQND